MVGLLGISGVLGLVASFLAWLCFNAALASSVQVPFPDLTDKLRKRDGIVPWIPIVTGIIERIAFTVLIAANTNGWLQAAAAWIALKLAAGWNRGEVKAPEQVVEARGRAFVGLLSSVISLAFAYWGGTYCLKHGGIHFTNCH